MPESVDEQLPFIDELGGPTTDPHYPIGWAMAGNAPFRRCKRDTHRGGNTDPLVVHWPAGIADPGALRTQYHHVVDVYPTLLELAGLPVPTVVNGVEQMPIEGHSFAPTIADGAAPDVKTTQYYEMLGSRAIYHEGWMAVTWHKPGTDWNDDRWELYDQRTDYTQAWDLADEQPEKLAELIELWWDEARRHNVLPLDDRGRDRFIDPTRPTASEDRDVYRYYPGTSPIPNPSLPIILNCPHSFTVRFRLDDRRRRRPARVARRQPRRLGAVRSRPAAHVPQQQPQAVARRAVDRRAPGRPGAGGALRVGAERARCRRRASVRRRSARGIARRRPVGAARLLDGAGGVVGRSSVGAAGRRRRTTTARSSSPARCTSWRCGPTRSRQVQPTDRG